MVAVVQFGSAVRCIREPESSSREPVPRGANPSPGRHPRPGCRRPRRSASTSLRQPRQIGKVLRLAPRVDRKGPGVREVSTLEYTEYARPAYSRIALEQTRTEPTTYAAFSTTAPAATLVPAEARRPKHACACSESRAHAGCRPGGPARTERPSRRPAAAPLAAAAPGRRRAPTRRRGGGRRCPLPRRPSAPGCSAACGRAQLGALHLFDRVDAADHRPADGVLTEQRGQERVTDEILGVVVAHRDLLEHHLASSSTSPERHCPLSTTSATRSTASGRSSSSTCA